MSRRVQRYNILAASHYIIQIVDRSILYAYYYNIVSDRNGTKKSGAKTLTLLRNVSGLPR